MSPADIEVQRKAWREKIDKLRAQGRLPRPGEREVCATLRTESGNDPAIVPQNLWCKFYISSFLFNLHGGGRCG